MNEAREACIHHWLLETPSGEISTGTCKKCGEERQYYNIPDYMREEANSWKRQGDALWADKIRRDKVAEVQGRARTI